MKPLVIAHRGASRVHPGNTLAAFQAAIDVGAEMIELDVRRTLDGVLIVQHDARHKGLPIDRWRYEDLAANAPKTSRRLGRPVGGAAPTLEETLQLCAGKIRLDVELKEGGHEAEILELLLRYMKPKDFVITSFLDGTIAAVKRLHPEVKAGLLVGSGRQTPRAQLADVAPYERLQRCHADFVAAYHLLVTERFLNKASQLELPVLVWTVNRPKRLTKLLTDPRICGVITDVPDLALELRPTSAKTSSHCHCLE